MCVRARCAAVPRMGRVAQPPLPVFRSLCRGRGKQQSLQYRRAACCAADGACKTSTAAAPMYRRAVVPLAGDGHTPTAAAVERLSPVSEGSPSPAPGSALATAQRQPLAAALVRLLT